MSQLQATIEMMQPRKPEWDLSRVFWFCVGLLVLIKLTMWVFRI